MLLPFCDANFVGIALTGKLGAAPRDGRTLDNASGPLPSRVSRRAGRTPRPASVFAPEICEADGQVPTFTGTKPNSEDGPKSLPGRETPMLRPRGCGENLQPGAVS